MVESLSEAKNENESAFDKFWDEFQLFPSKSEDKLFKQRRWIILAAIGPLFLLVLESALISQTRYQEIRPSIMFRDLGDPIFTYISLALLAGGWMFVQIWRADIKNGFRSVVDNKLIEDNVHTDYRDFLQAYRRQLHSHKRYIPVALFTILGILAVMWVLSTRDFTFRDVLPFGSRENGEWLAGFHLLTRWVLAPIIWAFYFGLAAWVVGVTSRAIRQFIAQFQPRVWPSHPDKIGGLKPLADLCTSAGLVIIVVIIPFAFFGARTVSVAQSNRCVSQMENRIFMGKDALASCYVNINHAFGDTAYTAEMADEDIQALLDEGYTTFEIVADILRRNPNLRGEILDANWIYIVLFSGFVISLPLLGVWVIWPLWVIAAQIRQRRRSYEAILSQQAIELNETLAQALSEQDSEKAEETREALETLAKLYPDAIGYPSWPVRLPNLVGKIVTPSLLMTGVTYTLSFFNIVLSEEIQKVASGIFENLR